MNVLATTTAWKLVGFGGNASDLDFLLTDWDGPANWPDAPASVRIKDGRTLYEAVDYNDHTPGDKVRLARVTVTADGIRQINRWVDADTTLEVVLDPA
jgi:hypothetical protein